MSNPSKTKILIVDDDEDDYFIISEYIHKIEGASFIIDWCNDFDIALQKLAENNYDLYFIDYRLGNQTGLELLNKAMELGSDQPIILLTGKGNKAIDVQAMKGGATDYLVKSELNTEKLDRCIRYSLDRSASLRAIKESESKYRNLFESSKDALFIADKNLKIREVNNSACLLFGRKTNDLIGRDLFTLISDTEQQKGIRKALKERQSVKDIEIEIKSEGAEVKNCLLSASIQINADAEVSIAGIVHDITNLKKAESLNLQAEKYAANERLLRILAHEIRNPLNNIGLSADNFKLLIKDDWQKSLLDIIQRNTNRINQIITELLDSTRQVEMEFNKQSLQDILNESIAIAIDRINLQKIKLNKGFSDRPLYVQADESKLRIAFSNLIINAVEAMEAGKGELSIYVYESSQFYTVSVQDNGAGIPKEFLNKLFEPFFTMKKNGLGLGLAAAYSIFKSHNAHLTVKSEVNKGTNFLIDFNKVLVNEDELSRLVVERTDAMPE